MNRPPKCTRRLFTLTLESDSDLHFIAERIGMTYSEAVRLGLHLAAARLRDNPPQVVKTLIPGAFVDTKKISPAGVTAEEEGQEIKSSTGGEIHTHII